MNLVQEFCFNTMECMYQLVKGIYDHNSDVEIRLDVEQEGKWTVPYF